MAISAAEQLLINKILDLKLEPDDTPVPGVESRSAWIASADRELFGRLRECRDLGMLKASLGSMDAPNERFLLHDTDSGDIDATPDDGE